MDKYSNLFRLPTSLGTPQSFSRGSSVSSYGKYEESTEKVDHTR